MSRIVLVPPASVWFSLFHSLPIRVLSRPKHLFACFIRRRRRWRRLRSTKSHLWVANFAFNDDCDDVAVFYYMNVSQSTEHTRCFNGDGMEMWYTKFQTATIIVIATTNKHSITCFSFAYKIQVLMYVYVNDVKAVAWRRERAPRWRYDTRHWFKSTQQAIDTGISTTARVDSRHLNMMASV